MTKGHAPDRAARHRAFNRDRYQLALVLASVLASLLFGTVARGEDSAESRVSKELRAAALDTLHETLKSDSAVQRLRAAEWLLLLDHPGRVDTFLEDVTSNARNVAEASDASTPVVLWRVLALASRGAERDQWMARLWDVALDGNAHGQASALHSLALLTATPDEKQQSLLTALVDNATGPERAYAAWLLAAASPNSSAGIWTTLLRDPNPRTRQATAEALQNLPAQASAHADAITAAWRGEPRDSPAWADLAVAAWLTSVETAQAERKEEVLGLLADDATRAAAIRGLARRGISDDIPRLTPLLEKEHEAVRAAAAYALLRIDRRRPSALTAVDWAVIVAYALGMIGVGWYYSRRTDTTEDYLLGGRRMSPWAVGLSLFATMLSTLTYLAVPGEMIKHGPMIASQLLIFPVVVLVVGWLIIPSFMKLPVTSAYEILETRLGIGIRLLGSGIFVSLRLLWMGVIIYATTSKVLVPLLGWGPDSVPYVCAVLTLITVVYTSLGGLQAVVFTDVAQTFILLGGAVLTVVLISVQLGGVGAWWPDSWDPNWDELQFWFDPSARITVASACLAMLTWYICTAGSDQMAVQRYLATRDVPAARRMFTISVATNAVVISLLAVMGLALLAFFRAQPHLLPDGATVANGADKLLPQFVVVRLPMGLSGLVLAALLAAAMSSLSSGINATCSVVTVDFYDRFRRSKLSESQHMRLAKYISWLVGAIVIALSFYASLVPGNLLEVTYRVVNLFVAPLFVLFFLAMYLPWATPLGAWLAGVASIATAIGIAFFDLAGLNFLWIMPGSLVVGIGVGALGSLLPSPRPRSGSVAE